MILTTLKSTRLNGLGKLGSLVWLAICGLLIRTNAAESNDLKRTSSAALPLETLVAEILEFNPELQFYRAEIAAAKGERRTAATWANPELSATIGDKRLSAAGLSEEGVAWSVSVQQTFDWPGRLALRKTIANHQIQMAELGFEQFKSALAARARQLAYELFAAQEKAAAAGEVADRIRALREVLVQRESTGLTPLLELRIIEATEITLHHEAGESALETEYARLKLNQLRGRPWTHPLHVEAVELSFADAPAMENLLTSARQNNFTLKMRQVELEQQGFQVSLAEKDGFPSLSVGPYYSEEKAGDRERQIGLGISIPLPLWNRNQGTVASAQARQQQAETSLYVAQREVEREVAAAALTYQAKLKEMGNWKPDAVREFRQAAALADRHYRLGAVPITTYIELQKQYLEAVRTLLDTKRQALEAAQQIQTLTGLDVSPAHAKTRPEQSAP